jgi:hypothetical protein
VRVESGSGGALTLSKGKAAILVPQRCEFSS